MSKVALYSRLAGEPAVPVGWYITCPDAHVGPYTTQQAAHTASTRTARHCGWPHQITHLPEPASDESDEPDRSTRHT